MSESGRGSSAKGPGLMAAGAAAAMFGTGGRGATTGVARHRTAGATGHSRGEDGKFLDQFLGAAMRADGLAGRAGRADEQFKIFRTFRTMKFVEWHSAILPGFYGLSSNSCTALSGGAWAEICRIFEAWVCWGTWNPTTDAT